MRIFRKEFFIASLGGRLLFLKIMDKKQFASLSTEHKFNLIKSQLDIYVVAVSERSKILPTAASLAATLLVVATFNEKIIQVNDVTRVLLSILLLLIPFSLWFHNLELKKTAERSIEIINNYQGEDSRSDLNENFLSRFLGYCPDFVILIISVIIFILIYLIWY